VSGNGDDGLDGITVTSAVAVGCVTPPGTDAVGLSSATRTGGVHGIGCQIFLFLTSSADKTLLYMNLIVADGCASHYRGSRNDRE
jgi:hypothetical protein